jgi:hypothetical protein
VDLDGLFVVANLAGRMLARACGGEAQAVALVDSWIPELVRDRARAAVLHLDLGSLTGLRLLFSFGLGWASRGPVVRAGCAGTGSSSRLAFGIGPRSSWGGQGSPASMADLHRPEGGLIVRRMNPSLVRRVDPQRPRILSDLGAGERDRTADLPFTRSPVPCTHAR